MRTSTAVALSFRLFAYMYIILAKMLNKQHTEHIIRIATLLACAYSCLLFCLKYTCHYLYWITQSLSSEVYITCSYLWYTHSETQVKSAIPFVYFSNKADDTAAQVGHHSGFHLDYFQTKHNKHSLIGDKCVFSMGNFNRKLCIK